MWSLNNKMESSGQPVGKHTTTLLEELRMRRKTIFDLVEQGQLEKVVKEMYTEDAKLLVPGKPAVVGKKNIGEEFVQWAKSINLGRFEERTHEVGYMNDRVDRVFEVGCCVMFDKSDKVIDSGKYIRIYEKSDGSSDWKVCVNACNSNGCKLSQEEAEKLLKAPVIQKTFTAIGSGLGEQKGQIQSAERLLREFEQLYSSGNLERLVTERYTHDGGVLPPLDVPRLGQAGIMKTFKSLKARGVEKICCHLENVVGDENDQFAFTVGCYKFLDSNGSEIDSGKYLSLFRHDLECKGDWLQYRDIFSSDNSEEERAVQGQYRL